MKASKKLTGRSDVGVTSEGRSLRGFGASVGQPVELSTGCPQTNLGFFGVGGTEGRGDTWLKVSRRLRHPDLGDGGKSYPQADDDRVRCAKCRHLGDKMVRHSFSMKQWDTLQAVNHLGNQWMFEKGVARFGDDRVWVQRMESDCKRGCGPIPDIPHRCAEFAGFETIDSKVNEGDAWWQDSESNTANRSSWWEG